MIRHIATVLLKLILTMIISLLAMPLFFLAITITLIMEKDNT